MTDSCLICNEVKFKTFACDNCKTLIRKSCANLTASEVKVIELKEGRVMKFFCPPCNKYQTYGLLQKIIDDKQTIIESNDEIIALLKREMERLRKGSNESTVVVPSEFSNGYANAVKLRPEPVLIVKAKDQRNKISKKEIMQKVNPADVNVMGLRQTTNGAVVIRCEDKSRMSSVKNVFTESLSPDYIIETPSLKKPRLKINR